MSGAQIYCALCAALSSAVLLMLLYAAYTRTLLRSSFLRIALMLVPTIVCASYCYAGAAVRGVPDVLRDPPQWTMLAMSLAGPWILGELLHKRALGWRAFLALGAWAFSLKFVYVSIVSI